MGLITMQLKVIKGNLAQKIEIVNFKSPKCDFDLMLPLYGNTFMKYLLFDTGSITMPLNSIKGN